MEAVRGARRWRRADFLVHAVKHLLGPGGNLPESIREAQALLTVEDDEELAADAVNRGGRPPAVRRLTADDVIAAHANMRRDAHLVSELRTVLREAVGYSPDAPDGG